MEILPNPRTLLVTQSSGTAQDGHLYKHVWCLFKGKGQKYIRDFVSQQAGNNLLLANQWPLHVCKESVSARLAASTK